MRLQLSSPLTLVFKLVFPAAFCTGFLAVLWLRAWPIAVALGLGALLSLIVAVPLKHVVLDDEHAQLEVSNYLQSEVIPCSRIAQIRQNRKLNIQPVWVFFAASTRFGDRIAFIPKFGEASLFEDHPVVDVLRSFIEPRRRR